MLWDAPCGLVPGKIQADEGTDPLTCSLCLTRTAPKPLVSTHMIHSVQAADKKSFDNASYLFTWDIFAMEWFI